MGVEEIKGKEESAVSKAKDWLINNIGFILIILIVVVNAARTFLGVELTGKAVAQILSDGVFSLIFGWIIKSTLQEQGLLKGLSNKDMLLTKKLHSETAIRIKDKRPKLQSFCDKKNAELRIQRRMQILQEKNINYNDVFNEDTSIINVVIQNRLENERLRLMQLSASKGKKISTFVLNRNLRKEKKSIEKVIKKAWKVKIIELTPSIMTSDGGKTDQPFDFGQTLSQYSKKKASGKLVFSIASMIVFGTLKPAFFGFDVAAILWGLLQIGTLIAGGILSFFTSYMFIIDTYRKGIIRKIDYLEEFESACNNNEEFVVPIEIISSKGEKDGNKQQIKQLLISNELS